MLLNLDAVAPLIRIDEGGAVRIGKSRITLALVVEEYENGMTPEDIVRAYDSLELADVYAAIAYYLRHREAVREYMKRRDEKAEALRAKIEAHQPRISLEELAARRVAMEKADVGLSSVVKTTRTGEDSGFRPPTARYGVRLSDRTLNPDS